jgi:predicted dehydrogenase
MADKIRWGIIGTGDIAKKFARGLQVLPDAELAAIASRKQESADEFAGLFKVSKAYPSYEQLAADNDLDVVYIATPHHLHCANAKMCLEAGRAVLCEKPFAINAQEAQEMAHSASRAKKFLMEAMWTRFIPAVRAAQDWIREGRIGEVRMVQGSFGYRSSGGPTYDPACGGGSLLDVGVYPITLADLAFNGAMPNRITGFAHLAGGIDEQAGFVFGYEGGGLAVMASAVKTRTPSDGWIMGTEAAIRLHAPFWRTQEISLVKDGETMLAEKYPLTGNGYNYEAQEVMDCLRAGKLESAAMPLEKSIQVMHILDELRDQWGLAYPMEI